MAGTYTTLVANKLGLREYRSELVHGHVLSLADIDAAIERFAAADQRASAAVCPASSRGARTSSSPAPLIAREACRAFGLGEVRCSEADILEGAALALADGSLAPS